MRAAWAIRRLGPGTEEAEKKMPPNNFTPDRRWGSYVFSWKRSGDISDIKVNK
jgi:hypothetical protein